MADIVLVEDNDAFRRSATESLRSSGHSVTGFVNGPGLHRRIPEILPDILMLGTGGPPDQADRYASLLARLPSVIRILAFTADDAGPWEGSDAELQPDVCLPRPLGVTDWSDTLDTIQTMTDKSGQVGHIVQVGHFLLDRERRSVEVHGRALQLRRDEYTLFAFIATSHRHRASWAEMMEATRTLCSAPEGRSFQAQSRALLRLGRRICPSHIHIHRTTGSDAGLAIL